MAGASLTLLTGVRPAPTMPETASRRGDASFVAFIMTET
jgi:hypothetical protein